MDHLLVRLVSPFNSESRFFWPFAIAVFIAIVAHVVWYYWPVAKAESTRPSPDELGLRSWAMWINVIVLIWLLVLLLAKVPFWMHLVSIAANFAALAYIYFVYLPPREAAWVREQRRLRYIPKPERRRRRR